MRVNKKNKGKKRKYKNTVVLVDQNIQNERDRQKGKTILRML